MRITHQLIGFISTLVLATSSCAAMHHPHSHRHRPLQHKHQVYVSSEQAVDLNTADAKTLARKVKGVGKRRAQAIVTYRDVHGRFSSIEDLVKVRGISQRMLSRYGDTWKKVLRVG